jgi:methanethiol S-methyltransferase
VNRDCVATLEYSLDRAPWSGTVAAIPSVFAARMNESLTTYLPVALIWSAYLALHSAMISVTVTTYLRAVLGDAFRFYRLFFNLVAIVALVPIVIYSRGVKGEVLFTWDGYLVVLKWALVAVGLLIFAAGSRHYDMLQFLGIRQIKAGTRHSLINKSGALDTSGVLGLIRHPYYTATVLLFWASDLDTTTLVINIVVTVYVVIGTLLEERKLRLEFGESYRRYQAGVSMFVPWKWAKGLAARGR